MRSELITDRHLARRAVIYIRQSSPHQVLTNQESLRLQYALRQQAKQLTLPGEMGERFQAIGFARRTSLAHAFLAGDLSHRL